MTDYLSILRQYWHYDDFRPLQAEIIHSIGSGRDTLALLPTGGGKSICFQVPAMAMAFSKDQPTYSITGVPDEIRGMVVKATVVLHKDWKEKAGEALVKELQAHVKHETAPYKYPRIIEFVDELPKTISGKIRRVEIREKDKK